MLTQPIDVQLPSTNFLAFFLKNGNKSEVGRILEVESRLRIKVFPTVGTGDRMTRRVIEDLLR